MRRISFDLNPDIVEVKFVDPESVKLTLCLLLLFLLCLSESPIISDFAELCLIMYII